MQCCGGARLVQQEGGSVFFIEPHGYNLPLFRVDKVWLLNEWVEIWSVCGNHRAWSTTFDRLKNISLPARNKVKCKLQMHYFFPVVCLKLQVMVRFRKSAIRRVIYIRTRKFRRTVDSSKFQREKQSRGGLEPPTPRSEVWCAIHCATGPS